MSKRAIGFGDDSDDESSDDGLVETKRQRVTKSKEEEEEDGQSSAQGEQEGEGGVNLERRQAKLEKRERKRQKPFGDIIEDGKQLWERIRQKKVQDKRRQEMIDELFTMCSGNMLDIVYKREGSRMIQSCVHYGSDSQRDKVLQELEGNMVELSKNKYTIYLIKKMLKYGSNRQRKAILGELSGNVGKLLRHSEGSAVVDYAYNDYANAKQKRELVREFYGNEFALFSQPDGTLEDLFAEYPEKQASVIGYMQQNLGNVVEKGLLKRTIMHRVLQDFLRFADESQNAEMLQAVKEYSLDIMHTREGARICNHVFFHAPAKTRKTIIKTFKGCVASGCKGPNSHTVFARIMELMDDTVQLHKLMLKEMIDEMETLVLDRYSVNVLLSVLSPRNSRYFGPSTQELMEPLAVYDEEGKAVEPLQAQESSSSSSSSSSKGKGKGKGKGKEEKGKGKGKVEYNTHESPHSKKPDDKRREEILGHLVPAMVDVCTEKVITLTQDQVGIDLLVELIVYVMSTEYELDKAGNALVDAVVQQCMARDCAKLCSKQFSIGLVKRIVQRQGKEADKVQGEAFAERLLAALQADGEDAILALVANTTGAFVVLSLLEAPQTSAAVGKALKSKAAKSVLKKNKSESRAVQIILEKE